MDLRPMCGEQPLRFERAAATRQATAATTEPRWVRWLLIGVSLGFLGLFLVVPLLAVFAQALRQRLGRLLAVALRRRRPVGHPPDAVGRR